MNQVRAGSVARIGADHEWLDKPLEIDDLSLVAQRKFERTSDVAVCSLPTMRSREAEI